MYAKIILNEIAKKTSGLTALGIGKSTMTKGYDTLNYKYPISVNLNNISKLNLDKIFNDTISAASSDKIINHINYVKKLLTNYTESNLDDFIILNLIGEDEFLHTDDVWEDYNLDENLKTIDNIELNDGNRVIFSMEVKYDKYYNIGLIYLNKLENRLIPYHEHFLFVKYK